MRISRTYCYVPLRFDLTSVYRIILYYIILCVIQHYAVRRRSIWKSRALCIVCSSFYTCSADNDVLYILYIIYIYLCRTMCCRYQFFLQLKQDILQGRVPVTQELMAELGAYVVQCEYTIIIIIMIILYDDNDVPDL